MKNMEYDPLIEYKTEQGKNKVGMLKFSFIVYFCVCGGSFGSEELLNAYPLICFVFLLVIPIFWNLPISMMTSELGLAMPSNDGVFTWINAAFGQAIAFMASISYWIYYIVSASVYCVLLFEYLSIANPTDFDSVYIKYGIPIFVILVVMIINLLGADFLGALSGIFSFLTLAPFVVVFFWALAAGYVHPSQWVILPPKGFFRNGGITNLITVFNIALWNNTAYDSVGSMIEELKEPNKNIAKSMILANVASVLTYVVTIVGFLGLDKNYTQWVAGDFATFAEKLGGVGLKYAIVGSSVVANFAVVNAYMLPCSMQLYGIGGEQYLDIKILRYKHPKTQTPWVSIFVNAFVCAVCIIIPFNFLVSVTNVFYCCIIIMMSLSMIVLRFSAYGKNLTRPFYAARSNLLVIFIALLPICIATFILVSSIIKSYIPVLVAVGSFSFFLILFFTLKAYRSRSQVTHAIN